MKKIRNNKTFIIIFILMTVLFLSIPIFFMPDSIEYYRYLRIYYGIEKIANWNIVRGFSLPTILFIFTKILGKNIFALTFCSYFFWAIIAITSYLFLKKITNNYSKFTKNIIFIIYYLLVIINPVLFGYYHSVLTEFVAITMSFICCIISIRFLQFKANIKNIKTYIYIIIFSFLFIITWFLKQPYFSIAFFPLILVVFLSIFKYKSIKDFLYRFSVLLFSIIILLLSMSSWKTFLEKNGVDYKHSQNNESFLREAFFNGMSNVRIDRDEEHYTYEYLKNNTLLKKKKIKKLLNSKKNFRIINVYNNKKKLIDTMIFKYKGKDYTSVDSIKFYFKAITKHPISILESYINGYLATIDIYVSQRDKDNYYWPELTTKTSNHENYTIGLGYLNNNTNTIWLSESNLKEISSLEKEVKIPSIIKKIIIIYGKIIFYIFKAVFIILPIASIKSIYNYIKDKKKSIRNETIAILLCFSFLHIVFHVVMGAIIDRYVFITFPEVIIGLILMIIPTSFMNNKKEELVMDKKIEKKKKDRLIFIIPAYNESANIEKVLNEIKKDVDYADILVINDCSKDNTKEIVEKNGVKCISNIFNLKYAMAVQTGIKYAYENGYDYVIQFDADGQHIAKEAEKLYKCAVKTNADIVIGSRYLKDVGYPCPFFRKLGTKMFVKIISLVCNTKISDPTSGFQCLNRRVIERYSKMGNYPEFPDANLIIEMLMNGYKIEEVSTKMRLREAGESMHGGIIKPIKYMVNMFYTIFFLILTIPRKESDK